MPSIPHHHHQSLTLCAFIILLLAYYSDHKERRQRRYGHARKAALWERALEARDRQAELIMGLEGQRRLENWAEDRVVEVLGLQGGVEVVGEEEVEPWGGVRKRRVGDARGGAVGGVGLDELRQLEGSVGEESKGESEGELEGDELEDEEEDEPMPKRRKRNVGDAQVVPTPRVDTEAPRAPSSGERTYKLPAVPRTESSYSSTSYPHSLDEEEPLSKPRGRRTEDTRPRPAMAADLTLGECLLADHLLAGDGLGWRMPLEPEPLLELIKRHLAEMRRVPGTRLDVEAAVAFGERVSAVLAGGA